MLNVAWVPDGSGVVFSLYEDSFTNGTYGAIYYYDLATSQITEIFRLENQALGNLSVSPDGETIVFERSSSLDGSLDTLDNGARLLSPCSLWLVDRDGSNLRQLTEDGRQPAWTPDPNR
ncbi:MAG: hypothetical protein P8179_16450 [Candidatus Thiodiazotropha sp.]|jgi:Tol biopolymer transport system component